MFLEVNCRRFYLKSFINNDEQEAITLTFLDDIHKKELVLIDNGVNYTAAQLHDRIKQYSKADLDELYRLAKAVLH